MPTAYASLARGTGSQSLLFRQPIPSVQARRPTRAGSRFAANFFRFAARYASIWRQISCVMAANFSGARAHASPPSGGGASGLGQNAARPRAKCRRPTCRRPAAQGPRPGTKKRKEGRQTWLGAEVSPREKETEGKEKEEPFPRTPYKKKEKRKGKKV